MASRARSTNRKTKKPAVKGGRKPVKKWSSRVTQTSDALDVQPSIFKADSPTKVARSLKNSSDHSKRRKGTPLQSAMSMLNFYINRAGKNLDAHHKKVLTEAKNELRQLYGRPRKNKN